MLQRYIASFLYSVLLLWANPYTPYKTHNKMQTTQYDTMQFLQQCADGKQQACAMLLRRGLPNPRECMPHVCHIVGAVLSANGQDNEAVEYLQHSCHSAENLGCTLLGLLYQLHGKNKDAENAYNIACNHGDVVGCYNMGMLQAMDMPYGKGGHAALQAFGRACSMQYPKACFNLAVIYANYKHDLMRARYFFHIACDYGMLESCKNARLLQDSGVALPPLQKKRGLYMKPKFE